MISLKQIHYALAVEQTLHFKRASELCSVSQSALSTALSEMEKQLGFQVFERDNKKVLVTPLGQEVLDKARLIKLQMEDLNHIAEQQKEPLSVPLSLGVIPTIGPYILPKILPAIQSQYPNLELKVVEATSAELVRQVRDGDIDTAILALPYPLEGLLSFKFWEEDLVWVGHRDQECSQSGNMAADELKSAKLMLLQEGHCLTDHALSACKLPADSPYAVSATSLSTLVQLALGKLGSTLVPEIALEQLVEPHPELKTIPLADPGPHRELAFIVRPNYPSLHNIDCLKALTQSELEQN